MLFQRWQHFGSVANKHLVVYRTLHFADVGLKHLYAINGAQPLLVLVAIAPNFEVLAHQVAVLAKAHAHIEHALRLAAHHQLHDGAQLVWLTCWHFIQPVLDYARTRLSF